MWNNNSNQINGEMDNIIAQINDLAPSKIKDVLLPHLIKVYGNKPKFRKEANINKGTIQPDSITEKTLIYLFKNLKWENTKREKFTREKIAEVLGRKPSEISRSTRRLIQMGLVKKDRFYYFPSGRFRNFYSITTEGIYKVRNKGAGIYA